MAGAVGTGQDRAGGTRALAVAASVLAAAAAGMVFYIYGAADGVDALDILRAGLIFLSTWWLAWGAATALLGLTSRQRPAVPRVPGAVRGRTVVIVPVYNEDPCVTFARVAAMDDSLRAADPSIPVDFAILSDTRDERIAAAELRWFARLLARQQGEGRLYYRRREKNTGRKAGNIEEFVASSGAAWDYAVILDADSLMEGATIHEMIRRIEADPRLGLLQTLPRVVRARSVFGRATMPSSGCGPGPNAAACRNCRARRPSAAISSAMTMSRRHCWPAAAGPCGWTTTSRAPTRKGRRTSSTMPSATGAGARATCSTPSWSTPRA
jgi:membrane glycosyltransferase